MKKRPWHTERNFIFYVEMSMRTSVDAREAVCTVLQDGKWWAPSFAEKPGTLVGRLQGDRLRATRTREHYVRCQPIIFGTLVDRPDGGSLHLRLFAPAGILASVLGLVFSAFAMWRFGASALGIPLVVLVALTLFAFQFQEQAMKSIREISSAVSDGIAD